MAGTDISTKTTKGPLTDIAGVGGPPGRDRAPCAPVGGRAADPLRQVGPTNPLRPDRDRGVGGCGPASFGSMTYPAATVPALQRWGCSGRSQHDGRLGGR